MNMTIRPATSQDRSSIIELLRQSLGESTIPKSTSLWEWKHEQNPFGPSFVLVAEEGSTLIGVRAFMQWTWRWKENTYQAIRAVDTATHPEHQGKGIFKKLTLQQLELCKQQGIHFVFNTPNEQSRPGYLKMGWVQQGKMPLKIKILQPLSIAYSKFFNKEKFAADTSDPSPQQVWDPAIFTRLKNYTPKTDQLTTILSPEYIAWRYSNNPLFRYNYFTDNENYLLISRIKTQSFTKELRLVDFMLLNPSADVRAVNAQLKKSILKFCKDQRVEIISFSGQQYQAYRQFFSWMGIVPVKELGPIVTVRDLNMNDRFADLLEINNWCYSLGDMELF
jgi:predicted N-acetyltransferase YhbS